MPFTKGNPGRPKGAINKATREIKGIARALVEDPAYVASLTKRMREGRAPHMETLLHYYAYGKPKETVDVTGAMRVVSRVVHEHHPAQ